LNQSKRGRRKKEKISVTFEREEENPIKGIILWKSKDFTVLTGSY